MAKTASRARIAKSIDDAMQLSDSYGFEQMDFGHTVIFFVFSIINILTGCILEDWGAPSICSKEHDNVCAIGVNKHRSLDGKGSPLDRRDEQREHLRRNNILMALEVVENITANKSAQVFLRPEIFKSLLQRLQLTVALKSKNVASANTLLDNLMTHIQKVRGTGYQLGRSRLLRVHVSTQPSSSAARNMFGTGKGSCWIPFDLFMENAMDGRHLHAISSIEALTELSKMLQVLNRATWQETFQSLWVSALRLIQRDPGTLEGPFPHLDSRLCMLLAIVPLAITPILMEDADNLERGVASSRKEELVSSLHVLGQFFGLLSPPPAALHAANTAATKAAVAVYSLMSGSENIQTSKDSFSIKAVKDFSSIHQSPWQALMEGSPLMGLKDVLMVIPASSLSELEKLHSFSVSGSEEEKLAASKILCGASFLRGWNIRNMLSKWCLNCCRHSFP